MKHLTRITSLLCFLDGRARVRKLNRCKGFHIRVRLGLRICSAGSLQLVLGHHGGGAPNDEGKNQTQRKENTRSSSHTLPSRKIHPPPSRVPLWPVRIFPPQSSVQRVRQAKHCWPWPRGCLFPPGKLFAWKE